MLEKPEPLGGQGHAMKSKNHSLIQSSKGSANIKKGRPPCAEQPHEEAMGEEVACRRDPYTPYPL